MPALAAALSNNTPPGLRSALLFKTNPTVVSHLLGAYSLSSSVFLSQLLEEKFKIRKETVPPHCRSVCLLALRAWPLLPLTGNKNIIGGSLLGDPPSEDVFPGSPVEQSGPALLPIMELL